MRHLLFRVALGYVALVWLLSLAILIIFPLLRLPEGSVVLAISLLALGLPFVLLVVWVIGGRTPIDRQSASKSSADKSSATTRIEHAVIVALILIVATIGIDQFVLEERNTEGVDEALSGEGADQHAGDGDFLGNSQAVSVGIISPQVGSRLTTIGIAHENAIRLAFERLGRILMGATEIDIRFVALNDLGDPSTSVDRALRLANEDRVVAILGPVNSAATQAVLEALREQHIDIPVISSLSTAHDIFGPEGRDANFFRVIFDDAARMAALARFIESEMSGQRDQRYLLAYENDTYGQGLRDDLLENLVVSNHESAAWCDLVSRACSIADCEASADCDRTLDSQMYDEIRTGNLLGPDLVDRLRAFEFDTVVLLGTVSGSLAIANGMASFNDRLRFIFVGSNKQLFDEAPIGSVAIGNPVLDPAMVPNAELAAEYSAILRQFAEDYGQDPSDFTPTAYEAAMVLHSALRSVLADKSVISPVQQMRRELLETLEVQRFDSLEPWRQIDFSNGELVEPHSAPIYRMSRGPVREDDPETRSWVEIDVEPRFNYLEGPIRVTLRGHSVSTARVRLSRVRDGQSQIIRRPEVVFAGNEATVDFHVFQTGLYRVSVEGADATPLVVETRLVMAPTYFVSVIAALIGALIVVSREQTPLKARALRIVLGAFAGFALTFSALYGTEIAGWLPFPKFGDDVYVNAVVTGLIGGLIGPYVLAEAFLSWALTFSIRPSGSQPSKEIPEGL